MYQDNGAGMLNGGKDQTYTADTTSKSDSIVYGETREPAGRPADEPRELGVEMNGRVGIVPNPRIEWAVSDL